MFISRALRSIDMGYITGPGGRKANNALWKMQGMNVKSLKHHVALQPLFVIIGAGLIFVGSYVIRLASKTTDINWSKEKDYTKVMAYYENRQFKMLNPNNTDFSHLSDIRPKFTE